MADGRRVALVAVAIVVASSLAAWIVLQQRDDVLPPPRHSASAKTATPPAEHAASAAPSLVVTPSRAATGQASVHGVVYDGWGRTLADVHVQALRSGQQPQRLTKFATIEESAPMGRNYPPVSLQSDANGAFHFDDLDPDEYTISADLGTGVGHTVQLQPGERANLDLRFPESSTMVVGEVRRHGEVLRTRAISLLSDGIARFPPLHRERDGSIRSLVPCGTYTLTVYGASDCAGDYTRPLSVPPGPDPFRFAFDMPDRGIDVRVQFDAMTPLSGLMIEVRRPTNNGKPLQLFATAQGNAMFDELSFGEWIVEAKAPWLIPIEPQRVELTEQVPKAHVVMHGEVGGIVRVSALCAGTAALASPATAPVLTSRGRSFTGCSLRGGQFALMNGDFGFSGVPAGPAELHVDDRETDGRITFLPFDPLPPQPIDIVPGDNNRIDLQVQPRARVKLRAVDTVGRDDLAVTGIEVRLGERSIASEQSRPTRWRAYLPPGQYLVVVARATGNSEQRLDVGRENIDITLRP